MAHCERQVNAVVRVALLVPRMATACARLRNVCSFLPQAGLALGRETNKHFACQIGGCRGVGCGMAVYMTVLTGPYSTDTVTRHVAHVSRVPWYDRRTQGYDRPFAPSLVPAVARTLLHARPSLIATLRPFTRPIRLEDTHTNVLRYDGGEIPWGGVQYVSTWAFTSPTNHGFASRAPPPNVSRVVCGLHDGRSMCRSGWPKSRLALGIV